MPLQNRVTPFSAIEAVSSRGLFMGNRGCLHNENREMMTQRWRHRNWIICRTDFNGRKRALMTPGQYTELFFLDEAVALAAGHRPCGECRHAAYRAYQDSLEKSLGERLSATDLDKRLHEERVPLIESRIGASVRVADLPEGAMLTLNSRPGVWLVTISALRLWTHDGYAGSETVPGDETVNVITPPTSLVALRGGYRPVLHASAMLK